MLKKSFLLCFLLGFVFCACTKANPKEGNVKNIDESKDLNVVVNPQLEKLQRVFAKLSEKTRLGIANGDPNEFLADLQVVLDSDVENLLVLTDKKHLLESTFVPEDIIPLERNDFYRLNRNDLSLRIAAENLYVKWQWRHFRMEFLYLLVLLIVLMIIKQNYMLEM